MHSLVFFCYLSTIVAQLLLTLSNMQQLICSFSCTLSVDANDFVFSRHHFFPFQKNIWRSMKRNIKTLLYNVCLVHRGTFSSSGDTMSTSGDVVSTSRDIMMHVGEQGDKSLSQFILKPRCTEHPRMYS